MKSISLAVVLILVTLCQSAPVPRPHRSVSEHDIIGTYEKETREGKVTLVFLQGGKYRACWYGEKWWGYWIYDEKYGTVDIGETSFHQTGNSFLRIFVTGYGKGTSLQHFKRVK